MYSTVCKVKSRILTDSPIQDRTEQETLARAAAKKKHNKGAKNYRNKKWQKNATKNQQFLLQVNVIKIFQFVTCRTMKLLRIRRTRDK
jgi:hypothetical protein